MSGVIVLVKGRDTAAIYYAGLGEDGSVSPRTGRLIEVVPAEGYYTPEDRAYHWAGLYGVPFHKESFVMQAKEDRVVLIEIGKGAPGAGRFRLDVNQSRITISSDGLVALLTQVPEGVWEKYHEQAEDSVDSDDDSGDSDEDPADD